MIGTASRAPCSVRGSLPPSAVSKRAPICESGTVTRPMGRFDNEASPMQRVVNGVAAMRGRVGERFEYLVKLDYRARPSVRHNERRSVGMR